MIILIVMILSLSAISGMAQKTIIDDVTFKTFSPGCSSTAYKWVLTKPLRQEGFVATAQLFIDGVKMDETDGDTFGFSGSFTYPELTGSHTIKLRVWVSQYETSGSISETITCGEVTTEPQSLLDGRICFAPGQAPAAIYLYHSGAFDVYAINGDDNGELVIRMTTEDLDKVPGNPETNLVVKESNRIVNIKFIRLSTGENQINVGPEPTQGKVWECVFDATSATVTDWFAN